MWTDLMKMSPYKEIPEWFVWEIEDIIDLTNTLIISIREGNWPTQENVTYSKWIWDMTTTLIHKLFTTNTISAIERNRMVSIFTKRATWEHAVNYLFYFLDELYFSWYLIHNVSLLLAVREVLIEYAKETSPGRIIEIDWYASRFDNVDQTEFDYSPHVIDYTCEIICMVKQNEIEGEETYLQSFVDFIFSENILSPKGHKNIIECTDKALKIHSILFELLLLDYYEFSMTCYRKYFFLC